MPFWLVALIAFAVLYKFYIPIPAENVADRIKVQIMELGMRLTYFYPMLLLNSFGVYWQVWWARRSLAIMVSVLRIRTWFKANDGVVVTNVDFDGVPVITYQPLNRRTNAAVILIHGGGFVLLNADAYSHFARRLARSVGATIFSIDYRMAPEHVFPAAVDDCEKAISYLLNIAYAQYDIDPHRVAIVGDSAGGNLAAGSAFRLIDNEKQLAKPKAQVLLYPLLQFIDFKTPSYSEAARLYGGSALADPESVARLFSLYVGLTGAETNIFMRNRHVRKEAIMKYVPFITEDMQHSNLPSSFGQEAVMKRAESTIDKYDVLKYHANWNADNVQQLQQRLEPFLFNPDVSPMMRKDLSLSPETLLITCQYDPLRDEGYWYAKRLQKAGVNVTWKHYDQAFHGIINLHDELQIARRMLNDVVRFLIDTL